MLSEIRERMAFWRTADRISFDIPTTYWRIYFKSTMLKLCKSKFRRFDDSAEFRPGAFAVGCSKISIGKRVKLRPGTMLFGSDNRSDNTLIIEDYVMLGSGVHIYTNEHNFENLETPIMDQGYREPFTPVHIERDCYIGANVIILAGTRIGEHSIVAAGSVVSGIIPPYSVLAGNPARIIRKRK